MLELSHELASYKCPVMAEGTCKLPPLLNSQLFLSSLLLTLFLGMITYLVLSLVVSALILGILEKCTRRINAVHYPPGPKGLPLIGNILDMPQSHEWLTYSKWAQQWGKNHFASAPPSHSNLAGL